jgi:DNA uptake protein ComE-like DNA-binding protein
MKDFKQHIYFTKNERNGLIFFIVIMALVVAFLLYRNEYYQPKKYYFEEIKKSDSIAFGQKDRQMENKSSTKEMKQKVRFKFDPNTISKDSLFLLGINKFAINNLIKYRAKGKIKNAEQFANIYGMDEIVEELEPYIEIKIEDKPIPRYEKNDSIDKNDNFIESSKTVKSDSIKELKNSYPKKEKKVYSIEINETDSFQLQLLDGIGTYYSSKIIKYRDKLGGFYSLDQLYEIDKLPKETVDKIKPHLKLNQDLIKKINVNSITSEEFGKHPYIGKKRGIIFGKYRKNHPNIKSFEDFSKVRIFDTDELKVLQYYITY